MKLERLKGKVNHDIDLEDIIERLAQELNIEEDDLYSIILDVILLILDYTNQEEIAYGLRTTFINMIKDYYYLGGYNRLNNNDGESEDATDELSDAKTITLGDTTVTFEDKNKIEVNGTTYNTGTVDFDRDILIEKYADSLNRHRRMRW